MQRVFWVIIVTCIFGGIVRAQVQEPNPPFDPARVTIDNEPPWFLNDKSILNPYSDPGYNPKQAGGLLSPLIFTHQTIVHGGFIWKKGATNPKILLWFRHPEVRGNDVSDPAILDLLMNWNAGSDPSSLPLGVTTPPKFTVPSGPSAGTTVYGALNDPNRNFLGAVRKSYAWGIYGGFSISGHGQNSARRIEPDRGVENARIWDISHPDAFKNAAKYDITRLIDPDSLLNEAAFKDAGYSAGLRANIYCSGHTTLADGRLVVAGGNDMNSSNGLYKINIFDPETETWAPRAEGCHRKAWADAPADDPYFEARFAPLYEAFFNDPLTSANKAALYFLPGECNPVTGGATRTETMENGFPFVRYEGPTATQPHDKSDMRYARWYPTALHLPNDTVLIVAGQDKNESVGTQQYADPITGKLAVDSRSGLPKNVGTNRVDAAFSDSLIFQTVPELYDPKTDRTVAMENSRLLMPNYPHWFPVQTGPGADDWMVVGLPGRLLSEVGGDQSFNGPYGGQTWLFDVQGALADPGRAIPGEKHLTLVASAFADHQNYGMTAELVELGTQGETLSHKVIAFGGKSAAVSGADTKIVEMIDFAKPQAEWKWERQADLYQTVSATKVVPLPDFTVLIAGGQSGAGRLEDRASLHFQLYNPADGITTKLNVKTTVPKGSHGNLYLLPDATAMFTGDDHINSVQAGDRVAPFGDTDLGVDTAQIFEPAYLFKDDGTKADRPRITDAPEEITYGKNFHMRVRLVPKQGNIKSVTLYRSGNPTHSMGANTRLIKLAFSGEKDEEKDELKVIAPTLPVQALPGDYTLFVIDDAGVPSVAKHVRVKR